MRCDYQLSENQSAHPWNSFHTEVGVCGSCLVMTDETKMRYHEEETGDMRI